MEEKEVKRQESGKLSYNDLENAAKQISIQAEGLAKENQQLRIALQQSAVSNMYTELNFRFKVLEYNTFFSKEFVAACVAAIEDTMTPAQSKENTDLDNK